MGEKEDKLNLSMEVKMNRPYIRPETIREINIKEIEKKKAKLRQQREFILEQQRQAFQQQQTTVMSQMMTNEEQEEDYGMTM